MAIPFNQLPIGEGMLPDGTRVPFFVDRGAVDLVADEGPAWKFHDARFLPEAVSDPDAIFAGLQRPGQVDSFCYSVAPTKDPDDDTDSTLPPVFGRVFLAFVKHGLMGLVVFDWEWRPTGDEPGQPEDWQTDFARRVWSRQ